MINLLNSATDKLQLVTSAAATVDVFCSWVDLASGSPPTAKDPGRTGTAITTATTTDIVATPASGNIRNVKTIHISNKDASLPCTVTVLFNAGGTSYQLWKQLIPAGSQLEYIENIGWFLLADVNSPGILIKVLTADDAGGTAGNSVQPWFPTNGTLTLPAATTYHMNGHLWITSGATSHSTGLSFGGTATLTSIDYVYRAQRAAAITLGTAFSGLGQFNAASNNTIDTAGTAVGHYIQVDGILRVNAAGTLIPQFTFSANPTGTITIKRNSYFRLTALGDNTLATLGSWS